MADSDSGGASRRAPHVRCDPLTSGEVVQIDERRPVAEHAPAERADARPPPMRVESGSAARPLPAPARTKLEELVRSGRIEDRLVRRARIVLLTATGMTSRRIAREVGCALGTVSKWQRRFAKEGVAGLVDAPRFEKPKTSDATPKEEPPGQGDRARLDKLQDASNTASVHTRNVYVTFLLFGLYLAVIFGSTTHEQLLRESPVTLPLLNVGLPLVGFYWVAPALFVLLHLNLLIQIYLLSEKLHRLDRTLRLAGDVEWADEQRAQLYPFTFSQLLIGRQHDRLMQSLLWLMVWLTVLVLPVVLLLMAQVRFLPYHDAWTTMWHRFLVAADVLVILILWRPIRHPTDRLLTYPRRWPGTR